VYGASLLLAIEQTAAESLRRNEKRVAQALSSRRFQFLPPVGGRPGCIGIHR
jgi:hypothetical protein